MPENIAPAEVVTLLSNIGTSINTLITQDGKDVLGEPWLSQLKGFHASINTALADMPETEKVPAAQEASWSLRMIKSQLLNIQGIMATLQSVIHNQRTAIAAMPSVEAEVKKLTESGALVTKEVAGNLVAQARTDAEAAGFAKGKLLADRRSALALANIPAEVAATAPDAVLLGEQKDFDTASATALDRVNKLKTVGLSLASAPMKSLPWGKVEDFDSSFACFQEIANATKTGQSNNTAPVKPTGTTGFAGTGKPAASDKKAEPRILC